MAILTPSTIWRPLTPLASVTYAPTPHLVAWPYAWDGTLVKPVCLANAELGERDERRSCLEPQRKARLFMQDRPAFMRDMYRGIEAAQRRADRLGLKLCVRLNGATDIAWEGVRFQDPIWSEARV